MCQGEYVAGHLWDIAPLVTDDSDTKTNYLKSFKTPLAATSDLKHNHATQQKQKQQQKSSGGAANNDKQSSAR